MAHPYQQFEGTSLWNAIDAELRALETNRDLTLTAAREYVIGALCKRLVAEGLSGARPSDAPAS
jgi:hypothetical protein